MKAEPVKRYPDDEVIGKYRRIVRCEFRDVHGVLIGKTHAARNVYHRIGGYLFVRTQTNDMDVQIDANGTRYFVVEVGKEHKPAPLQPAGKGQRGKMKPGTVRVDPASAIVLRAKLADAREEVKRLEHRFSYQPDNHEHAHTMTKLRTDLDFVIAQLMLNTKG